MRYTRAALGLLNAQYRSVLKKCFLINMGLFALGAGVGISPAVAIDKDDGRDSLPTTGGPYYLEWYETDKSNNRAIAIQWNPNDQIRYYSWRMEDLPPDGINIIGAFSRGQEGGATYNNGAIEDNRVSYRGHKYEYFYIGNSADNGGAIYNDTAGSYKILDSNFIGNHADDDGGAIYNDGKIDSLDGTFIGNHADGDRGGAVCNDGKIDSFRGRFEGNHAYYQGGAIYSFERIDSLSGYFAENYAGGDDDYAQGGAISANSIGEISGTFKENFVEASYSEDPYALGGAVYANANKISGNFYGNYAYSYNYDKGISCAKGGAVYGKVHEIRGHFEKNRAIAVTMDYAVPYAQGGAIFIENGSDPIISGKFINNSAFANYGFVNGGAIYLKSGKLTIDGASEFTDNYIEGGVYVNGKYAGADRISNAIHNSAIESEIADGIVNFNSGNILINDGLSGENQKDDDDVVYKAIFNFNGQVTETSDNDVVTLNNSITNASTSEGLGNIEVNLNQGTLKLGHYDSKLFNKKFVGSLDAGVDFNVTGGKLTTQDGETNTHNLGNLKLSTNLNTAIDVDLNAKTGDKLTGSTPATTVNGSKILIDNIKIINDGNNNIIKVQVADSNIKDVVGLSNDVSVEMVNGSLDSYLVVYENTSGNLKFGKNGTLETAVQFGEGEKVFTSNVEILTKDDLGVLLGNSLSINGNGHTIDGQNNGGMSIANGQTVNMNDVSVKGFNGAFAENNGTMNIAASEGNEINLNSSISGSGAINVNGAGKTSINTSISNSVFNLNNGTLAFGRNEKGVTGTFERGVNFNVNSNSTLTLLDDSVQNVYLGNMMLNSDLNMKIDVDLANTSADTFETGSLTSNNHNIILKQANVITDAKKNITEVTVDDHGGVLKFDDNINIINNSNVKNTYLTEIDLVNSKIKFGKVGTLETAVQFKNASNSFTAESDYTVDSALGSLAKSELSINGNGHTIDGKDLGGMTIADNQTVNLNDVTIKGFNSAFAENNGTMNIAASEGNKVNLNSEINNNGKLNITGAGETNVNSAINGSGIINAKGAGNLNVDGIIENALNLENGTLRFGNNGGVAKLVAQGGSLTTQDGAINEHSLGQLDLQKDLNTSIDVDLSTKTGDKLTGSTAATSADGSKILIDNIKVLNDGTNHIVKIEVADANLKDVMSLADNVTVAMNPSDTNSYLVVYEKDDASGNLRFGQVDALETAVQFENAKKAFAMGSDISTDTDLGALTGESLSISGNSHTIDGQGFGGMTIADNQTVSLNDVTVEGFNGVFAENNGTMNIAASAGNELNLNSGITNNGKLNITGAGETNVNNKISGSGIINANGEGMLNINSEISADEFNVNGDINFNSEVAAGKMNLSGGELNLKSGSELAKVENFAADGGVLNVGDQTIKLKNAEFNDGSTVAINVKSDGNGLLKADSLTVNGGNLKATLGQGIVEKGSKTVTLLESGTAFTNNFADVMENNMYRFEKAEKAGDYIISLAKTAEEVSQENGGTQNNANAAKGWVDGSKFEQGSVSADVADKLADLAQNDAAGFNEALTALAPSDNPEVRTNSVNHNTEMFKAVVTHLDDGYQRARNGLASGDGSSFDGVSVWAKAFGNHAKVDDTAKAYGFKSDGYGATLGVEKQLSSSVKAGLGYSYFYNDVEGFNRDSDVNTHTGFVYGEYRPNNWYVNAIASYGYSDYNETKHVAGSNYKADYDVDNIGAQVLTGYNASVAKVDVTPEAGLRYNNIHRDNYVDSAGQAVKAETMEVMTAVAGVKVGKDLVSCFGSNEFYWRPEARLAATYDLISDKENAVVSLSNGSGYVVKGQRLNRFGVEAGAGVTFYLSPDVESSVGYEGKFRSHYQDHTGYVSAKYKF